MKLIADLKDVPDGTAMTILQADGTYLCISKIERPEVEAVAEPVKSEIVREMDASPLLDALVGELATLKTMTKAAFITSLEATTKEPAIVKDTPAL